MNITETNGTRTGGPGTTDDRDLILRTGSKGTVHAAAHPWDGSYVPDAWGHANAEYPPEALVTVCGSKANPVNFLRVSSANGYTVNCPRCLAQIKEVR